MKKLIGVIAISLLVAIAVSVAPSLYSTTKTGIEDYRNLQTLKALDWENTELYDYWGLSREYKEKRIQWLSNLSGYNYHLVAGDYVWDKTGTRQSRTLLRSFLEWEEDNHFPSHLSIQPREQLSDREIANNLSKYLLVK